MKLTIDRIEIINSKLFVVTFNNKEKKLGADIQTQLKDLKSDQNCRIKEKFIMKLSM